MRPRLGRTPGIGRIAAAGAHRLRPGRPVPRRVADEWGAAALAALDQHAPGPRRTWPGPPAGPRRGAGRLGRGLEQAETEPIEDLRVDLEDGYGTRSDEEEDKHAATVGLELAAAVSTGSRRPFLGIRFKSLEPATRRRGLRTLDLVLRTLLDGAELPAGWVITLPKVTSVDPGRRRWSTSAAGWSARTGWPRGAEVRDPGGDAAGRAAGRRHGRRRGDGARRGRPLHRAALRHLRLHRRRWASPAATRASTIRRPTTPRR